METPKLSFVRLARLDPNCRCCGRGTKHICDKCNEKLQRGYAFIIELTDKSTVEKKKPTGYAIAYKADQVRDESTGEVQKPGIYFVRESDLKQFLGDAYNNYRTRGAERGKLLSDVRKLTLNTGPATSPRPATELVHQ